MLLFKDGVNSGDTFLDFFLLSYPRQIPEE